MPGAFFAVLLPMGRGLEWRAMSANCVSAEYAGRKKKVVAINKRLITIGLSITKGNTMDQMQPMQQPMQEEAVEPAGTSIELIISDDGSMTINVEAGDGAAEPMPVADINEALAKIKQIAGAMLAETMQNAPAQQQEDAAFQQEMMA